MVNDGHASYYRIVYSTVRNFSNDIFLPIINILTYTTEPFLVMKKSRIPKYICLVNFLVAGCKHLLSAECAQALRLRRERKNLVELFKIQELTQCIAFVSGG